MRKATEIFSLWLVGDDVCVNNNFVCTYTPWVTILVRSILNNQYLFILAHF